MSSPCNYTLYDATPNPQAKPSGMPWTNPAIKAWLNVNLPSKKK